jgi:hypothetical protein
MSSAGKKLPNRCGGGEVTAQSSKATTYTRILRRLSTGRNLVSSSIRWAELPWESWPGRSRLAARLSCTPCKVGSSQPSCPDFIYRGLSLHGFWLINWIRNAPRTEIQEIYQKLGDLVADGSLSAAVEHVYPLEQFKEAFEQSLKSNRSGKILFKFGATDGTV